MAGISKKTYKLKNGKSVTKYTITYRDIFGKQRTSGLYDSDREAAKRLAEFEDKKKNNNKNVTVGDVLNTFMKKVNKKYANSTKSEYQRLIDSYLQNFMNVKYHKLDPIVFQNFLDDIELKTPFIANNILKLCKSAANYCKTPKIKLISENIFNDIEKVNLPETKKQNLTLKETFNILKECTVYDNWFFPILFTFIANGMRSGELYALTKSDFNFIHHTIAINKQYTKGELKHKTKTDKSNRYIFMISIFSLFMQIYLPTVRNETELVFPDTIGGYLNSKNVRSRHWYKLLIHCKYEYNYTSLHKLRAFFIDLMFFFGAPGKFVQGQVGHAKYETTYNNYASNSADIKDSALNMINQGMGIHSEAVLDKEYIKESFRDILISYVNHNPKIKNKEDSLSKINEFFGEIKKCEKNVRIFDDEKNCKIIQFPKRSQEL